jgi:hypothetical protein
VTRTWITLCALGLGIAALTTGALATAGDPDAVPRHLLLYVGAGVGWAAALALLPRLPCTRGQVLAVVLIGLAMRVPAWLAPTPHSDDVYRYLWDGRVQRAGIDPYAHPPDAPELTPLRDETWAHVNNRDLPTIYPPGAELLFRLAARSLGTWKLLVAAFDLGTIALLLVWLRRRGDDRRRVLAWAWSPLVAIELGANAHLDGVGAALLIAGLVAWTGSRKSLAGALAGAAAAVKLVGALALPQFARSWRALAGAALVLVLVTLPYAGSHIQGSLGEYSRRWRANDGAFALIHAASEKAVEHSRFRKRYTPGSPTLARAVSGRDRNQLYPDEVANLAARAIAGLLFLAGMAWAVRRRPDPVDRTRWLIGLLLLLAPTLHPWYVLWLIPLSATVGGPEWVALAVLVPLGYVPLADWLAGRPWHDPAWTRLVEHGIVWALLVRSELTLASRRVRSENP